MTELTDYQRMVSDPLEKQLRAEINKYRASADQLAAAIEAMFIDIRQRIDNKIPCDGRKDMNGEYEMPWGNSTQHNLDQALTSYEKARK
jgi:hypothetical protein